MLKRWKENKAFTNVSGEVQERTLQFTGRESGKRTLAISLQFSVGGVISLHGMRMVSYGNGYQTGGTALKHGKCPKCGSEKVYSGVKVSPKNGPFGSNSIPISLVSIAALDNYVCIDCGYVESYIADASKLKEIAKKWPKVKEG